MIFYKEATFPYPVLTNGSDDYLNNQLELDISLKEDLQNYFFSIEYVCNSNFINSLIKEKKAELMIVIRSKDNKFYPVDLKKELKIPKNRLSLNKRTSLQLIIQAREAISFENNDDLSEDYKDDKREIVVAKNHLLALSNIVVFDGSIKKPHDLFEKRVDPNLKSDIKIELGTETIIISYKKEDYQLLYSPYSKALAYPYIYMGMQKALMKMVSDLAESLDDDKIYLDDIEMPENILYKKLYDILESKNISELSYDNIDEVIYAISDKIIEKHIDVLKGLHENES